MTGRKKKPWDELSPLMQVRLYHQGDERVPKDFVLPPRRKYPPRIVQQVKPWAELTRSAQLRLFNQGSPRVPEGWQANKHAGKGSSTEKREPGKPWEALSQCQRLRLWRAQSPRVPAGWNPGLYRGQPRTRENDPVLARLRPPPPGSSGAIQAHTSPNCAPGEGEFEQIGCAGAPEVLTGATPRELERAPGPDWKDLPPVVTDQTKFTSLPYIAPLQPGPYVPRLKVKEKVDRTPPIRNGVPWEELLYTARQVGLDEKGLRSLLVENKELRSALAAAEAELDEEQEKKDEAELALWKGLSRAQRVRRACTGGWVPPGWRLPPPFEGPFEQLTPLQQEEVLLREAWSSGAAGAPLKKES